MFEAKENGNMNIRTLTDDNLSFNKALLIVFLPFAIGFVLNCLFRSVNAILLPSLEKSLNISITELGLITAFYFLAYGLFQIPIGVLLDQYGAKRVQAGLFSVAGIGLFIFSRGTSIWEFSLAHVLIGIGMAGGLMCGLKAIIQNFPSDKMPMLNGLLMMSGGLGILLASTPAQIFIQNHGWRTFHALLACITFIIALITICIVPEKNVALHKITLREHLIEILKIYKDRFFWRITPLIISNLGGFMAIQGLWVEGWLHDVNGFSQGKIDNYLILIGIAMTISLLLGGFIAKWSNKYNQSLINILNICGLLIIIMELILISNKIVPHWLIWFALAFLSQIFNLCYVVFAKYFPNTHTGRANAALNVLTFSTVFLIQYIMGFIINNSHNINHIFSQTNAYQFAFGFVVLIHTASLLWFNYFKDKTSAISI